MKANGFSLTWTGSAPNPTRRGVAGAAGVGLRLRLRVRAGGESVAPRLAGAVLTVWLPPPVPWLRRVTGGDLIKHIKTTMHKNQINPAQ